MGSSYALGLSKYHEIYGYDINKDVTKKALKDKIIISNNLELLKTSDLIILALYPQDNYQFVKDNLNLFNNQILTDLSGTKEELVHDLEEILPKTVSYTSHHPMAGKEKKGYDYKNIEMFKEANFLIVPTKLTKDKDLKILSEIANNLNFKRISIVSIEEHDKLIAFTSQLTHFLAVCLVNSDRYLHTVEATGDSYRDLTRIAKINEVLWTELFLENKDKLLDEINNLLLEINYLKKNLEEENIKNIKNYLIKSRIKREKFD